MPAVREYELRLPNDWHFVSDVLPFVLWSPIDPNPPLIENLADPGLHWIATQNALDVTGLIEWSALRKAAGLRVRVGTYYYKRAQQVCRDIRGEIPPGYRGRWTPDTTLLAAIWLEGERQIAAARVAALPFKPNLWTWFTE